MTHRWVSGALAAVFVFSAAVQWNDPDPLLWISLYGAVAAVSAAVAFGVETRLPGAVVLVAVLGVFALWAPSLEHTTLDALGSFGMSGAAQEEEVREALGLALAIVWLAALLFVQTRRAGRTAAPK